ncbi:MAG: hypothetical protein DHS20C21_11300 [Gemmatimonadota bacterium]|nr:MAG: hypothetical protein DHS20C21_11300 [Gemmatimonadota bacterium]
MAGESGRQELAGYRARLETVRVRVRDEFGDLSDEDLDRRPEDGGWSIAECARHVTIVNVEYLDGIEKAVQDGRAAGRRADGPFRYGRFGTWFVNQLEPTATRRLKAPKPAQPPHEQGGRAWMTDLDASFVRLDAALTAAEGLDLARIKVTSPLFRMLRFQLGIALRLLVVHSDRHSVQMQRVLARTGRHQGAHS